MGGATSGEGETEFYYQEPVYWLKDNLKVRIKMAIPL